MCLKKRHYNLYGTNKACSYCHNSIDAINNSKHENTYIHVQTARREKVVISQTYMCVCGHGKHLK